MSREEIFFIALTILIYGIICFICAERFWNYLKIRRANREAYNNNIPRNSNFRDGLPSERVNSWVYEDFIALGQRYQDLEMANIKKDYPPPATVGSVDEQPDIPTDTPTDGTPKCLPEKVSSSFAEETVMFYGRRPHYYGASDDSVAIIPLDEVFNNYYQAASQLLHRLHTRYPSRVELTQMTSSEDPEKPLNTAQVETDFPSNSTNNFETETLV